MQPPMGVKPNHSDRVTLLAKENVIHVDAHGLDASPSDIDIIMGTVERIAASCASKPYVVTNWSGTSLSSGALERYKAHIQSLVPLIRAVLRYGMDNSISRVLVKTTAAQVGGGKNAGSNIFATKDEVFAAIREGRV
jgi:hypothetical protein